MSTIKLRGKNLTKNTLIIAIGKVSTQIINFLLLPLYTYKLSTQDYGNFDFISTVSYFLLPVFTLLFEESMFRFLIDNKEEKDIIISTAFICMIFNSVLISFFGILGYLITKNELILLIILYTISCVLISISNALCRGMEKLKIYSSSNFISSVIIVILNLILILKCNIGFYSLIISNVFSYFVVSIAVFLQLKAFRFIRLKKFSSNKYKEMLKYSLPLIPNALSWNIINISDRLVIMSILGASYNGIYSVAYKFPNIISNFYSYFDIAWKEESAKIVRDNDNFLFNNIFSNVKKLMLSITLLLIAGMPIIYSFFIDDSYSNGLQYIPILAISVYYISVSGYLGGIFTGLKNTKILGLTSGVAAIINLSINLLLIKYIGLYASAISTLVAGMFMYYYRKNKLKKILYIKSNEIFPIIIFIIVISIFYINNFITHLINLLLALFICIALNKNIMLKILNKK